ncbi:MAG TPA: TaqI-like C-terminal specificity domain-containing protein, partial [Longimicrobiaceae bacterium]|nr:TaqI-like C-terminal specificity domain-containing protein [Longimicrobiaceae bacterium]
VRRPAEEPTGQEEAKVATLPREALGSRPLAELVEARAYAVPAARFGRGAWSLDRNDVATLMEKVRRAGVPLGEFTGAPLLYGIKTGLNEAFLLDQSHRDQLVAADPGSAEIIKPYLRGQDIRRWTPEWAGLWMIFARRGIDIDRYPGVRAHLLGYRGQLEPRPADWGGEWQGRKPGAYRWFELQDAVDYYEAFERPKLVIQRIAFHPRVALDGGGMYLNDSAIIVPSADLWTLGVLNSPTLWYYASRSLPHKKDEALAMDIDKAESLPVPLPPPEARAEAETSVARLIELTRERRALEREMFEWLGAELGVAQPGTQLERFADLAAETFLEEVRQRRSKKAPPLAPQQVAALRQAHGEYAPRLRTLEAKAAGLEHRLSHLVNRAYGLSPEDVELIWSTAPPRMPVGR